MIHFIKRLIISLTILSVAFVPTTSLAIGTVDENSLINDSIWFQEDPCAAGSGSDVAAAKGKDNMETIWNNLIVKLKKPFQVAGVMGNMQSESGFDPLIIQGGGHSSNPADAGGGGYGLVQWTPGRKLIPYLHGAKPSVESEVKALFEQLDGKGGSPERAAGKALYTSKDIVSATRAFELEYERHAGPPQPSRTRQAQAILKLAEKSGWLGADGSLDNGSAPGDVNPDAVACGGSGAGCQGPTSLPVPPGGVGTAVCYQNQYDQRGGGFDWGSCGCLPTSTLMILSALENKPNMSNVEVLDGIRKHGGVAPNNCSGISAGALAYMVSEGFKSQQIQSTSQPTTDASLAKIKEALTAGKIILTHTSNSVDSNNSGLSSSGHFLVLYAMDAKGNFYVANPAARGDSNKPLPPSKIKSWLDAFWAIGK